MKIVSEEAYAKRKYWIKEIEKLSGSFGADSTRVAAELQTEIESEGCDALLNHLRLCGDIPENYDHDSSEEKLYSKYTDAILHESFKKIGLRSLILTERGDAADVEAFSSSYEFVADAKVFRLSRTAKNQKDFKVQAMNTWKRGKPHAMVVCPIYQLPTKSSQIYLQSISLEVCIFTYSHLAVLCSFAEHFGTERAQELLLRIFKSFTTLNPSKDAGPYWQTINSTILDFDKSFADYWRSEKLAAIESIAVAKEIALDYLAAERMRIMRMSHADALQELIKMNKIDNRMATIKGVSDTGLMSIV